MMDEQQQQQQKRCDKQASENNQFIDHNRWQEWSQKVSEWNQNQYKKNHQSKSLIFE